MRKCCFWAIIFSVVQGCANQTPKTVNEVLNEASKNKNVNVGNLHYTFQLPQGWLRLDTAIQGLKVTLISQPDTTGNLNPLMNVTTELMQNQNAEDYVLHVKNQMKKSTGPVEMINDGYITLSGYKVLWFTYKYNRPGSAVAREMVYYSIPVNGISYNITAGVNAGGMVNYKTVFDKIVESFKLSK